VRGQWAARVVIGGMALAFVIGVLLYVISSLSAALS
jgi:high-affinity Fe2+/Pb2+ permease